MNDKTYADGIEDAAKVAEDTYCDPNWHGYYRAAGRRIAREIRALTPDKTNTSEATAIGAGEEVAQAGNYVLDGDYRMAYFKMCEAYGKTSASSKAGGPTPVVLSMLREAHDTLHECTAVLSAKDCQKVVAVMERIRAALTASPKPDTNTVEQALCNCAARFYGDDPNAHQLCCATIDHPIARSGMGIGDRERLAGIIRSVPIMCDTYRLEGGDEHAVADAILAALSPQQAQSR